MFSASRIKPHPQPKLLRDLTTVTEHLDEVQLGLLTFKLSEADKTLVANGKLSERYVNLVTEMLFILSLHDDHLSQKELDFIYQATNGREARNYTNALDLFGRDWTARLRDRSGTVEEKVKGWLQRYEIMMSLASKSPLYEPITPQICFNVLRNMGFRLAAIDEQMDDEKLIWLGNLTGQLEAGLDRESSANGNGDGTLESYINELNALVGLASVKQEVRKLVNFAKLKELRKASGLAVPTTSNHLVFVGNPGTGKTVVARLIAQIFASLGYLSRGHLVEADRSALVAGFVGQTALKTKQVLENALGGVLFIDEAYTLSKPNGASDYGQEAIDTLLKFMEDNRGDLIVIVAGYEREMQQFLASNPGLRSRFGKSITFDDYSVSELIDIFTLMAHAAGYRAGPDFYERLGELLTRAYNERPDGFGNARYVRNIFDLCIQNHADRISVIDAPTTEDLGTLSALDLGVG